MRCTGRLEALARGKGYRLVAGADEAGRGSLFGPVFAAAVILDPARPIRGLADSKTLPKEARLELAELIRQRSAAWAVARAEAGEIDRINIYQASRLAIRRAIEGMPLACDYLLVDALSIDWPVPQQSLIRGDARVTCIAAASILAKVHRDECLVQYDGIYPGYGLDRHKGYPTPEHIAALRLLGPSPEHRRSYAPVREAMQLTL